mmetsp:Transcript_26134/g.75457  ORF Transcript_26134/g.75457 Transcript_26134/m.75457 type:complete len:279 (-) Transcript_26134:263-1099(-)
MVALDVLEAEVEVVVFLTTGDLSVSVEPRRLTTRAMAASSPPFTAALVRHRLLTNMLASATVTGLSTPWHRCRCCSSRTASTTSSLTCRRAAMLVRVRMCSTPRDVRLRASSVDSQSDASSPSVLRRRRICRTVSRMPSWEDLVSTDDVQMRVCSVAESSHRPTVRWTRTAGAKLTDLGRREEAEQAEEEADDREEVIREERCCCCCWREERETDLSAELLMREAGREAAGTDEEGACLGRTCCRWKVLVLLLSLLLVITTVSGMTDAGMVAYCLCVM